MLCRFILCCVLSTLVVLAHFAIASSASQKDQKQHPGQEEPYSFEQYVKDYDKTYRNPQEYAHHEAIFQANMAAMNHHNKNNRRGYTLGVNQFTDLLPEHIPMGYVKPYLYDNRNVAVASRRRHLESAESPSLESVITTVPVDKLPKQVDWRQRGITTPVKNQYYCGSCWAFASTAVIESHVAKATGLLFSLSEQELVSCAKNPLHCGGSGGCAGATAEIAMEYARTHGMVDEWTFAYESNHGATVNCTLQEQSSSSTTALRGHQNDDKHYLRHAVAGIGGWLTLPRNNYTAVMNAVAQIGPLSIVVACNPWLMYKEGVYSGELKSRKETDVNHMVVLEGYGTDPDSGTDYWLVRNSWGPKWGEAGYIRLKRVDPSTLTHPDDDCGVDVTSADGIDCTIDGNGEPIRPPDEKICGNSGLLFDVTIPLNAYLL